MPPANYRDCYFYTFKNNNGESHAVYYWEAEIVGFSIDDTASHPQYFPL